MQRISEKMMAGPLWVGCSFSWSKTLPPLNSQCLIVGKISSIKGLIVYCLFGLKWKRRRDEKREARKGVSLCFWSIWSHILLAMGFRQRPAYHSRCTWMGCVCLCMWRGREEERETERERKMLKEVRCYGLTICRPPQHLLISFRIHFQNPSSQCNNI